MTDDLNINELLNGYIDGELTTRQQVELKRLVDNDPAISKKLNRLKRTKMMVNALPKMQAPANMLRDVKLKLEGKALHKEPVLLASVSEQKGSFYSTYRKVLTVAAMIALVAVLISVIYTIVAPSDVTQQPISGIVLDQTEHEIEPQIEAPTTVAAEDKAPAKGTFNGRIILTAENLLKLDAFVNRTIIDLGLNTQIESEKSRSVFDFKCSHSDLEKLLAQLSDVWQECDSKTLQLYTQQFQDHISVQNVKPQQIIQVASLGSIDEQAKVAQEYNVLNSIKISLPGQKLLTAAVPQGEFSFSIPKPRLASSESEPVKQTTDQIEPQNVNLTIVVQDSK
ncbi:MAG: anti-sigma factor family protein [Planctomycetota bacterium]|jgi:hypothetical protein